jgi:mannose-6-phosphate isomerase-like protein (cupin superfamily)
MPVIPWEAAPKRARPDDPDGFAKAFVNPDVGASRLRMHVSVISPGKRAHAPHSHPEEEIMYVLAGRGTMLLGDERTAVGPDTGIFIPSGVLHGIENTGDQMLRYMVILQA